jgi:hypothetical protein
LIPPVFLVIHGKYLNPELAEFYHKAAVGGASWTEKGATTEQYQENCVKIDVSSINIS